MAEVARGPRWPQQQWQTVICGAGQYTDQCSYTGTDSAAADSVSATDRWVFQWSRGADWSHFTVGYHSMDLVL